MSDQTLSPEVFPYLMKFQLTVIINNDGGKEEKVHLDGVAPLDEHAIHRPWYVLLNKIGPEYCTKKYGHEGIGWIRMYERKIIKIVNRQNPADIANIPLRVQTLEQLKQFCTIKEIVVPIDEFATVEIARQMVMDRLADPLGYEIQLEEYRAGKNRQVPELDNMRKQEDLVRPEYENEFDQIESNPKSIKPPKKQKIKTAPAINENDLSQADADALGGTAPQTAESVPETPKPKRKRASRKKAATKKVAEDVPANPFEQV